jgi:hypothetical protein
MSAWLPGRKGIFKLFLVIGPLVLLLLLPVHPAAEKPTSRGRDMDISRYSPTSPEHCLRALFIHHSCGGQWLAPAGPDQGKSCIYESAVNGGDLRRCLREAGYEVHEASYGSLIGEQTDIFDWPAKFRDHAEAMLRCDRQDACYEDERRNDIVLFKSCFPNNFFVGQGAPPGDPRGPELTVENAKAAYRALLLEFRKHPQTLFVAITAPPLARQSAPLYKVLLKRLLQYPSMAKAGEYARQFNNWLKDDKDGWLSAYAGENVVVFDLFDVLTNYGASNFSCYPSGPAGDDDHPNTAGNRQATEAFVPFLNRAARRAGLTH